MTKKSIVKLFFVRDRAKFAAQPPAPPAPIEQDEFKNVRRWESSLIIGSEAKSASPIKAGDEIIDYKDVMIKGYLSTFKDKTPSDRDGDYVVPGAFDETLSEFKKNPVLLLDHWNQTDNVAGSFTLVRPDREGLYVEAALTNAPQLRDVRIKIVEGHLKALSMGGIFYYQEDGRGIFKVKLWEGSIVAIPSNPDALFRTRSLNEQEKKFVKSGGSYPDFRTFLIAHPAQNPLEVAA